MAQCLPPSCPRLLATGDSSEKMSLMVLWALSLMIPVIPTNTLPTGALRHVGTLPCAAVVSQPEKNIGESRSVFKWNFLLTRIKFGFCSCSQHYCMGCPSSNKGQGGVSASTVPALGNYSQRGLGIQQHNGESAWASEGLQQISNALGSC